MKIKLQNAGKRFNREWIFKNVTLDFSTEDSYAITGPNGSGKSTFLQALGGILQVSEGNITYHDEELIPPEKAYSEVTFCAPYMEIIEEMTLIEFFQFHNQFKTILPHLSIIDVISIINLESAASKQIRYYSSGMKQRVKLAQAILFQSSIVLLDEPCSNLDVSGINLYHLLIEKYCKGRMVIVSSNDEVEYKFCNRIISISYYK